MKIKNRIEEKDEHSHKLEILNQNSNSALLGVDPWIDWMFSLPWSSPVEEPQNFVQEKRTKVKRGRRMKKIWEKKNRKEFDLKACTMFDQNTCLFPLPNWYYLFLYGSGLTGKRTGSPSKLIKMEWTEYRT